MARLLIHVEGQTEETFVNEILRTPLLAVGYETVSARLLGNARQRQRRGGIKPWPSARKDILNHLREDVNCIASTMVDYYGLPQDTDGGWPGRKLAETAATHQKAATVESALMDDVRDAMDSRFNPKRFVPFVMMHEFEGLLFSDCASFCRGIGRPDLESAFLQIRRGFPTPEDINDSPMTAPSKRIKELLPEYEKPLLGAIGAMEIGLNRIRKECPHFDKWLGKLESLGG